MSCKTPLFFFKKSLLGPRERYEKVSVGVGEGVMKQVKKMVIMFVKITAVSRTVAYTCKSVKVSRKNGSSTR